jgi:hypothetical protein
MSERENPLLRWARLKQAAKADAASAGSEAMAAPEAPFDPASLPSIESIVADTDIIAFLHAGVPAELTQAALRRAWTSDPLFGISLGSRRTSGILTIRTRFRASAHWSPRKAALIFLLKSPVGSSISHVRLKIWAAERTIASNANANASDRQLVINNPPLVSPGAVPNEMLAPAEGENTPSETRKTRRHGSALPH